MIALLSAMVTTTVVLVVWFLAGWWGRPRDPAAYPWSATLPVLGGPEPPTHAWNRFHVRYYPMTLLFIAFEMEMMFMYPWAVVYVEKGLMALAEMGMFLAILSVGILYTWREGGLRWQ